MRNGIIVGVVLLIVAGAIAFSVVHGRQSKKAFATLSAAAGCTAVQDTTPGGNGFDRTHLTAEQIQKGVTVTYSTSPPTGGPHHPSPLSHGVFTTLLSTNPADSPNLYQAVHSLEHGYAIVWYRGLSDQQLKSLTPFGDQDKVLVVSYPQLPKGSIGLTAWGRLQYCDRMDTGQIQKFIDLYKLKTGPEPLAP